MSENKSLQNLNVQFRFGLFLVGFAILTGCSSPGKHRERIDETALKIIEQTQKEALGRTEPFSIETPEESLRKRLFVSQNLPYSRPASLGVSNLESIEHWPDDDYINKNSAAAEVSWGTETLHFSLMDALQVAARNSRQYQTAKENLFRAALRLDLQRDRYRNTFASALDSNNSVDFGGDDTVSSINNSLVGNLSRDFLNGISLSTQIGFDLIKLLSPVSSSSHGLFGDASISIPLLRGAGRHIASEPLTQAERDTVYAIYDFERFKRTFAVNIAERYFSMLRVMDSIDNSENNYRRVVRSTRLMKRLGDAGDREPAEVDQSIQSELSSRSNWISSQISYQRNLDSFKTLLGLPPDAQITLDTKDLLQLAAATQNIVPASDVNTTEETAPSFDAPVILKPPSFDNAGPYEIDEDTGIQLAFQNRLDLRIAQGDVYDAQRAVVIAADRLRAEFTLLGNASDGGDLNFQKGRYNALLMLDLPIERTSEIISYRESIINLERSVRNLQELEDIIKLDVRDRLHDLQEFRESLQIETKAVTLAERRVRNMDLSIQAGRLTARDLLDAQSSLLASQNSLTANRIDYRMAELALQRDLGVLQVNEKGIWKEFSPEE